jgi:hypothetical protein
MANSIDWGIASFDSEWGQGTSLRGWGNAYADKIIIKDFKDRVDADSGSLESLTCIEI